MTREQKFLLAWGPSEQHHAEFLTALRSLIAAAKAEERAAVNEIWHDAMREYAIIGGSIWDFINEAWNEVRARGEEAKDG